MPVGNSDRGVGLGAGEIMFFSDFSYQYFDWWHEQIDGAYIPNTNELEYFDHKGSFVNHSINLGVTIGLDDYWNITISQLISDRCMDWEGPVNSNGESLTVHHRTECSSTDFFDGNKQIAFGGYLGDSKINLKYLVYNQGKGPGIRLFIGGGLIIPSSYTITESPWTKTEIELPDGTFVNTYSPHRHFYLSDGAYKMSTEFQFFQKRIKNPVFWGGVFSFNFPLNESDYGFKPSKSYELSLLALVNPMKKTEQGLIKLSSIGFNFTMAYSDASSWDGVRTPNSEAIIYIPGVSFSFSTKAGMFGINFQRGYEDYLQNSPSDIKETNDIYAISLSFRKLFDKVIEGLYW